MLINKRCAISSGRSSPVATDVSWEFTGLGIQIMPLAESPASAVCSLYTLLRQLPGEVSEKFQIFSDRPRSTTNRQGTTGRVALGDCDWIRDQRTSKFRPSRAQSQKQTPLQSGARRRLLIAVQSRHATHSLLREIMFKDETK